MPTHRKPAALQNHALELLNAVIQLRPGIPEILVELLVDLLQRHCVNNLSRSVACDCKDNQRWPERKKCPRLVDVDNIKCDGKLIPSFLIRVIAFPLHTLSCKGLRSCPDIIWHIKNIVIGFCISPHAFRQDLYQV